MDHYFDAEDAIAIYWSAAQYSNRTRDIRGRPSTIIWKPDLPSNIMESLKSSNKCVLRIYYFCSASCSKLPSIAQLKAWGNRDQIELEDNDESYATAEGEGAQLMI